MSLESDLEAFILSKYNSLRDFTIKNHIPYSTLSTTLKRGINKTNWKTIRLICDALDISADDLSDGRIVERNESMSWQDKRLFEIYKNSLPEDSILLLAYHTADPGTQAAVRKLLDIAPPSAEEKTAT